MLTSHKWVASVKNVYQVSGVYALIIKREFIKINIFSDVRMK